MRYILNSIENVPELSVPEGEVLRFLLFRANRSLVCPVMTVKLIALCTDLAERDVRQYLARLKRDKLIREIGPHGFTCYFITIPGVAAAKSVLDRRKASRNAACSLPKKP